MDFCEPDNSLAASIADDIFYGNDEILKGVFVQVLDAVEACQRRGVFHRDLSPENVFLEEDGRRVVLANFARASEGDMSVDCSGGDERFMSPGGHFFCFSADGWMVRASLSDNEILY